MFSLFWVLPQAKAQEIADTASSPVGFGIEVTPLLGKVVKHEKKFTLPIPSVSPALDINFVWQTYGTKDWQQRRGFPVVGVGVTYIDYGIESVYGHFFGVYPNLQVPFLRRDKWEWTLRLGIGAGYVTKKYQTTPPVDTINVAISSHVNGFGNFISDVRYCVNEHWDLQGGLSFMHISNGAYSHPNLGINLFGANLSVRYFPATSKPKPIIRDLPKLSDRWLTQIRFGLAYNQAPIPGTPERANYCYNIYESRRWLSKNKFYAGANYVYKQSVYDFLKYHKIDKGQEQAHAWDGSFFVGNEFLVGSVGLIAEAGVYYRQAYLSFVPYYEKIGGNLYLLKTEKGPIKELFLSGRLLAHGIVAEYAEFGIGTGF